MTCALYKRKKFKYRKLIKSRKDFKNQIIKKKKIKSCRGT